MDIELARTFLAVVETGSFFNAAGKVNVTQSTVSMRIRALEQQLGQPVFERSKTGATMTAAGRNFQRHATTLVRTWTQAKLDAALPAALESVLEVGAPPSIWDGFLIDAIPALKTEIPNLAIKASLATSDTLGPQLNEGSLDLAIMYRPQITSGLAVEQLFEDEFVLVSSDSDTGTDPFGENYVLIDWGFEFRAHHMLSFPQFTTPRLQLGLGTLGLQYLRTAPASGYFPRRSVAPEVEAGWLRLIDDAPRFAYSAYAVFSESQCEGIAGKAARLLRGYARDNLNVGN
ncbi:LysR family transcriptional regulator [Roseobacter litoralis]|uniref:LysR family transcriptional regulator n=1 Tax=Roseobacter litoralis TaxID=42443 RepID=UPI0024946AD6|nr:LysR family transcriptional regulator [Roseobacter litoralis]